MNLKTMTLEAIMEFYESKCIKRNSKVNIDMVVGAGYKDGENIGRLIRKETSCSENILFTLERDLKESYMLLRNKEVADLLKYIFSIWNFEPWMDIKLMIQHETVFETYLYHFILGLSNSFMERAANCRKCMSK